MARVKRVCVGARKNISYAEIRVSKGVAQFRTSAGGYDHIDDVANWLGKLLLPGIKSTPPLFPARFVASDLHSRIPKGASDRLVCASPSSSSTAIRKYNQRVKE